MTPPMPNVSHRTDSLPTPDIPLVEGGMLGLLRILAQNRGLLWKYPLLVSVLVVAISFLFPNVYRSTVTILPPERDFQSMAQPSGDLKTFLAGGMALPVMATPSDILAAVLESRTVKESTIVDLNLTARWDMTLLDAIDELRDLSGSKVAPSGVVTFWVENSGRWFADTLANAMVQIADRLNQRIVNTKATRTRLFVEERLNETRRQLETASAELERFQKEHRTIALDVEVKAMVEGAATLRAQLTSDEIELSVYRESLSEDHPTIRALRTRIAQTEQRLKEMESPALSDTSRVYLGSGFMELPRMAQELAVRLRDVKVAEALYELLTEQYEHARIQERRDTPSFSVLDPAAGGGIKVRPKRALIGLGTLIVAFLLVSLLVIIRDWMSRLAKIDPERHQSIIALWNLMFRRSSKLQREMNS